VSRPLLTIDLYSLTIAEYH